jgi:hypothetical protein
MAIRPLNEVVDYLDQKHSEDQERIADNLVIGLYPLWQIMDFERLDRTSILWAESVLPRVRTAYMQSQRVAASFALNVRFATLATANPIGIQAPEVEAPAGVPSLRFALPEVGDVEDLVPLDNMVEDDVRLSLLVEGNFRIKQQMPVPDPAETMRAAQVNSTGAAVRQTLKGARNVTANVVKFDRKVLGYARFTDAKPCHFCALLASRGAVYSKESFAEADSSFTSNAKAVEVPKDFIRISKVHNNCRCTLRPVYSKSQEFDADAKFYRQQWKNVYEPNKHLPPDEIVSKWRDQFQPYQRKDADVQQIETALREREMSLLAAGFEPNSPQVRWAQRTQSLLA